MIVHCPHCQNRIRLVEEEKVPSESSLTCESCGHAWNPEPAKTAPLRKRPKAVGKFELIDRLGYGQFGEVWSARDPELDRLVAVKIPRKEDLDAFDLERIYREARITAQMSHPNIVKLLQLSEEPGNIYLVSELIPGGSLEKKLKDGWKPTWKEAAQLCQKLAEALQHAHEKGVIHRDLKPGNVLIGPAGEPKLTDFGLAKRDSGEVTMTCSGVILGTIEYMSPEQARGDGHKADARSDVYSLGVVLFELLMGFRPFRGGSQLILQQILTKEPPTLRKCRPEIPRDLETICLKCLEKDPEQRYQSAQSVANELLLVQDGKRIPTPPIAWYTHWGRWARRNSKVAKLLAACALLALALGIAIADNIWGSNEKSPLAQRVSVKIYPEGGTVTCFKIDPLTGKRQIEPVVSKASSGDILALHPGEYEFLVEIEGVGFQEVRRTVPSSEDPAPQSPYLHQYWKRTGSNEVELKPIVILSETAWRPERVEVPAGTIEVRPAGSLIIADPLRKQDLLKQFPPMEDDVRIAVSAFELAAHELTRGEAKRILEARRELLDAELNDEFGDIGQCDAFQDALKLRNLNDDQLSSLLTDITYDEALQIAEFSGMRLMTEAEYLLAATNGGRTESPWGNDKREWSEKPEPFDVTTFPPGISGLCTGIAEWTSSWPISLPGEPMLSLPGIEMSRVVKGHFVDSKAPVSDGIDARPGELRTIRNRSIGLRLARSKRPAQK